jgi:N-acetylglucosaminyl-diphospho-decaprenol L-rhamnosyltransferase
MPATPHSSAAVVTVSYNSSAQLRPFLASVRAGVAGAVRIVVADNASDDVAAAREICREFDAELLELPENLGYGGAVNRAVRLLGDEVDDVLISNPDVAIGPGALEHLTATMAAHPDAGAVGPRVRNPDGTVYPSARRLPSLRTGVGHALFVKIWPGNPWTARYVSDVSERDELSPAGWLSGSCLLVRRTAFDGIGGFDDAFFMYFEDVDLGLRLGRAGWVSYYDPAAEVTHIGGMSTSTVSRRMLAVHHDSAYRYVARRYSAWYLAPIRWAIRIGLALRLGWVTRSSARPDRSRSRS